MRSEGSLGFAVVWLLAAVAAGAAQEADDGVPPNGLPSTTASRALDFYMRGTVAEEAGELHRAAVDYHIALALDSTSATIALALAGVYIKLGVSEAAAAVLESSRRYNRDHPEILSRLGSTYTQTRQLEKAAECYGALARLMPLEQMALRYYAALEAELNRKEHALQLYREYLARFGPDPGIYEKVVLINLERRDLAAAETALVQFARLVPEDGRVYMILGRLRAAKSDWAQAEGFFRQAVAADSSDLAAWVALMSTLENQKKFEELLQTADAAMPRFPDTLELVEAKAMALEKLGRPDEALGLLDDCIVRDTTRLEPLIAKGFILHNLRRWEESAATYERALRLDPDNATVLNNYAYMLSEQNHRLAEAMAMVERALQMQPENVSFLDTKAWVLYRQGRAREALEIMRKVVERETGNSEIYYHLGRIYEQLGKRRLAKRSWKTAAELDPENETYRSLVK